MFRFDFGSGSIGCERNRNVQRTVTTGNFRASSADKLVLLQGALTILTVFPSCCVDLRWRSSVRGAAML